ncbi:MAG: UDP-N-acetylmuramoyl-L-alanyl-D-glutamate--2,6-diaminopimelate ligase [Oscillospiraceae bacterium]|nr:UDP-N-acetylmuramoyl-L-alanyl-D-glutamate--2,6-diaminopimelate ligase [Oscillospiraceae bacterium]
MKLTDLLEQVDTLQIIGSAEGEISALTQRSDQAGPGALFVCIQGYAADGHDFLPDACRRGARAFVVQRLPQELVEDGTYILVKDSRLAMAQLAAAWFGHPAEKMTMIGLTGTKGKTTTAFMTKKILEQAGHRVGMIGTVGAFIGQEKIVTSNTTPEAYELHQLLARMVRAGCTHVVMEVSSQAVKLKRTAGIRFDYGAFLNLSPDHISPIEHKDFQEYRDCKRELFRQVRRTVVNLDGEHWQYVTAGAKNPITVSASQPADLRASYIVNIWKPGFLGSSFRAEGLYQGELLLSMPGEFNVHNALVAMAIGWAEGAGFDQVRQALRETTVKGRAQLIPEAGEIATFIIDYAHNALSVESLLTMLKGYHPKRLIAVFGSGGNRAKQRRYDMGLAAGKYADFSVLTSDNPRREDPALICQQIVEGLSVHGGKYTIIVDRKEAIHYVMDHCQPEDMVVLFGKGHEEYQEIQGVKYPFSEEQIIREYAAQKLGKE